MQTLHLILTTIDLWKREIGCNFATLRFWSDVGTTGKGLKWRYRNSSLECLDQPNQQPLTSI